MQGFEANRMFYTGKFGRMPPLDALLPRAAEKPAQIRVEKAAGTVEASATGISHAAIAEQNPNKPHFSVKAKGSEGFVGSAWLNEGKYGKYISVRLRDAVAPGTTLYLSPTKENPEIL